MDLALAAARARVVSEVGAAAVALASERVAAAEAVGRWLAEPIRADRDAPPWPRAMRDGYALRAADARAPLRLIGTARAGVPPAMRVGAAECAEIMTGAVVPAGADCVAMVEHAQREGDCVRIQAAPTIGENIAARGSEFAAGTVLLAPGTRLDATGLALLASIGHGQPRVFRRPRTAILATGDELVAPFGGPAPGPGQIRNSNAPALAALCRRAGGEPIVMPPAADELAALGRALDRALGECDVTILCGGVSKGRFDLVPEALAERGAEVLFRGVRIRPGKPVVFGKVRGKFFFGLPGNPLSAMLTFELLARPALALLAGAAAEAVACPYWTADLGFDYRGRPLPLEYFLPVRVAGDLCRARVEPLAYHGSADVAALAAADGYLVVPEGTATLAVGSTVNVLPK